MLVKSLFAALLFPPSAYVCYCYRFSRRKGRHVMYARVEPRQRHRIETEKTSHLYTANRRKVGQPGERCSWSPFMFHFLFGIQYDFHLSSKRLLHQGRASRGLRRDRGRPPLFAKVKNLFKKMLAFDQGNQVE